MTTDDQVYCSVVWSPPKMFFWTITILFADKTGAEENRTSLFGAARLWHLEPSSTQNQNPEVLDGCRCHYEYGKKNIMKQKLLFIVYAQKLDNRRRYFDEGISGHGLELDFRCVV